MSVVSFLIKLIKILFYSLFSNLNVVVESFDLFWTLIVSILAVSKSLLGYCYRSFIVMKFSLPQRNQIKRHAYSIFH
jgi:hypothetical protein